MYVTHLGPVKSGEYGLGNQLFQIAATIGIAKAHNREWKFSYWNNNKYFKNTLPSFIRDGRDNCQEVYVKEQSFDYAPIVLPDTRGVILDGYFQSPKYFENSEQEIKKAFEIKDELVNEVKEVLYANKHYLGYTCSISVRRGDYVRLQHIHPLQPDEYWHNAQKIIEYGHAIDTYVVFSDDIEWCKQNKHLFNKTGKRVIFFSGRTQIDDFIGITLCKTNIITNSTFSWWGAWLNKNPDKWVVMPRLWFGPVGPWSGPSDGFDIRPKSTKWYIA